MWIYRTQKNHNCSLYSPYIPYPLPQTFCCLVLESPVLQSWTFSYVSTYEVQIKLQSSLEDIELKCSLSKPGNALTKSNQQFWNGSHETYTHRQWRHWPLRTDIGRLANTLKRTYSASQISAILITSPITARPIIESHLFNFLNVFTSWHQILVPQLHWRTNLNWLRQSCIFPKLWIYGSIWSLP